MNKDYITVDLKFYMAYGMDRAMCFYESFVMLVSNENAVK